MVCRGGHGPPAGPCAAANRADMESAPTGVCGGAGPAVSRRASMLAPARRAGVHARRTLGISKIAGLRRRGVPGTISGLRAGPVARLASETRLRAQCKHCPLHGFVITRGCGSPFGRGPSVVRRGGIYPSRGRSRRRGVRRDEGIPPYGRPGGRVPLPFSRAFAMVCRGGIYPSRGTLPRREPGGYGIRPYRGLWQREVCGFPAGRHVGPGP